MRISKTFAGMSALIFFIIGLLLCGLGYSDYFEKDHNSLAFIVGLFLCVLSFIFFLITLVRLFVDKN